MVSLYRCLGYHISQSVKLGSPDDSEEELRLQVALHEERRLNQCGLAETSEHQVRHGAEAYPFRSLGFLGGADVRTNVMFERLYKKASSTQADQHRSELRKPLEVWEDAWARIPDSLSLMEKLVLVSMHHHNGSAHAMDPVRNLDVAAALLPAFHSFFGAFSAKTLGKRAGKNMLSRIRLQETFGATDLKSVLDKLAELEFLKPTGAITDVRSSLSCI
jgi:hypothetical protein